jgi:hypothetical protein
LIPLDDSIILAIGTGFFSVLIVVATYILNEGAKRRWMMCDERWRIENEVFGEIIDNMNNMENIISFVLSIREEQNDKIQEIYKINTICHVIDGRFFEGNLFNESKQLEETKKDYITELRTFLDGKLTLKFYSYMFSISKPFSRLTLVCISDETLDSITSILEEMKKIIDSNGTRGMTQQKCHIFFATKMAEITNLARKEMERTRQGMAN